MDGDTGMRITVIAMVQFQRRYNPVCCLSFLTVKTRYFVVTVQRAALKRLCFLYKKPSTKTMQTLVRRRCHERQWGHCRPYQWRKARLVGIHNQNHHVT